MFVEENIIACPVCPIVKLFSFELNFTQVKLNTVSLKQLGNVMEHQKWTGAVELCWEEGCCAAQSVGTRGILGHVPWWLS